MKTYIISALIFLVANFSFGQFPAHVKEIVAKKNDKVVVKGNLKHGAQIDDLSWAWRSSTACFPGTQKEKFTGMHVLYYTNLEPYTIINIKVAPKNKDDNFSLYAYQIGTTNFSTVPDLHSCVSCEVDHKWDYKKKGKTQDHTRSVSLNAIRNPYNVVIGVVGANGLSKGDYELTIEYKGGKDKTKEQATVKTNVVKSERGKTVEVKGSLESGVEIHDLSWAWSSSVACFPGTQKEKFTGNHVIYETQIPKYSTMEITVIPKDEDADFSLYAYQIGANSNYIVPNLPSCVSCEADHKWDYPKKGKIQDHTRTVKNLTAINNPYKVIIGVVGAKGLKKGKYLLKIKVNPR